MRLASQQVHWVVRSRTA